MGSFARFFRVVAACVSTAPLLACKSAPPPPLSTTPTFIGKPESSRRTGAPLVIGPLGARTRVTAGPAPPRTAPSATPSVPGPHLTVAGPSEALSLEQVRLPAFINEVFSKTLKLNVQIDQAVMSRTDLVTLRTGKPLPAKELFAMAKKVLASYGIGLSWDGTVLHVATDEKLMAQMPELIRGRALPEIPTALRPIFQVIDLHQVSASDMAQWLSNAYGSKIKIIASADNSVMVFGLPRNVKAAVEAVRVLDQARLAGRHSLRVNPVYWTADDLASKLVEVLQAEGYDASASGVAGAVHKSAITIVPVEANNSLVAFAADPKVLNHVRRWIADLDQPGQVDPTHNIFVYQVQNTTAASLGRTVAAVLGGRQGPVSAPAEAQLEQSGRTQSGLSFAGQSLEGGMSQTQSGFSQSTSQTPGYGQSTSQTPGFGQAGQGLGAVQSQPTQPTRRPQSTARRPSGRAEQQRAGPRLVVDDARNALVLVGSAQDYQRIRPLLLALDKAPREALIEVTVVEVDLTKENDLGVEWTLVNHLGGGLTQKFGTGTNVLPPKSGGSNGSSTPVGGLPIGTSGFNYTIINNFGDVRFVLNAFAQDNRLSVLSTPRVLAESGQVAHIEVGTEVPIVTSQGTTNTIQNAGTTGILQSIEYRKTGVLLAVRPVVHSGNRIDLAVNQEVSQALPNSTPGISSPLIQNRKVSTQLTLSDGETVVIGGLISENRTDNDTGVPFLKDIPGLGLLFRNQSVSRDRKELLVFITPYVISNGADAAAITRQFQDQMKRWQVPQTKLRW